MSDTCFCEYTSHGHCGVLCDHGVDNDATLGKPRQTGRCRRRRGADFIAPSAAMDGQVQAIRRSLDAAGFTNTAIMSYSTKFASSFYGPFREAAGTALKGDRKTYQMSPMNRREAIRESLLDEARGRRLPDGETGWRLPGYSARYPRTQRSAARRLSGQRGVRDDQICCPVRALSMKRKWFWKASALSNAQAPT